MPGYGTEPTVTCPTHPRHKNLRENYRLGTGNRTLNRGHYEFKIPYATIGRLMITYHTDRPLTSAEFIDLLWRSTLGERRPIHDSETIAGMVANADLTVSAWDGERLVGLARSVTDWTYCCYLSDLAVDEAYQRQGIGVELMAQTQAQLGPQCKLILLAAPAAVDYYGRVGFDHHPSSWVLPRDRRPGRRE